MFELVTTFFVEVYQELQLAPNPLVAGLILFINGLWIPFAIIAYKNARLAWIQWREEIWHMSKRKFILLAIDVPRDNEQVPKAIENVFTHLHGIIPSRNTLYETWWKGKTVDFVSLELVSIEGYVQFLVYCTEYHRDIVESAFYSQYPDAEITQVEDYVHGQNGEFKDLKFPNNEYTMRGTEMVLRNKNAYPLRLHLDFEHSLTQEFKDPMAGLLESMNKIGPGEQMWIQIVATPEFDDAWQPASHREAMKIAGKSIDIPINIFDRAIGAFITLVDAIGQAVFPFYGKTEETKQEQEYPSLMLHLTPAEQRKIEGIQMKADKHAFWCKLRFIYIAKKEVYLRPRGESPIMGALKQFTASNLNSLVRHKWTKISGVYYVWVNERLDRRRNNLLRAYQNRARTAGSSGMILNTEELATLYHFPTEVVKAPLVARTQSKRASAPISLPIEQAPRTLQTPVKEPAPREPTPTPVPTAEGREPTPAPSVTEPRPNTTTGAPTNLPFI